MLPKDLVDKAGRTAQTTNQMAAYSFEMFCCKIIDIVAPLVPAVKPQAAFFEEYGPEGMQALCNVIHYARKQGLIVICDAKRGDIGSTAEAYARAYLAGADQNAASWGADALTINPYLGIDSLEPFIKVAHERGAGLYVLIRTSNPGSKFFQDRTQDGQKLFETVGLTIEEFSQQYLHEDYSFIGGVVGATYPQELESLRKQLPHVPFLIPGYGSQGGTSFDTAPAFDHQGFGALINSSRGINFAWQREPFKTQFGLTNWEDAIQAATMEMINDLAINTNASKLLIKN
jgi:orotidine-5'-phosphate decarboxylase